MKQKSYQSNEKGGIVVMIPPLDSNHLDISYPKLELITVLQLHAIIRMKHAIRIPMNETLHTVYRGLQRT